MPKFLETSHSAELYARACRSLATGVSSSMRRSVTPVPLYFERGQGPYYYDADGNELLDYTLAWGPLILGSNHKALNEAVARQLHSSYTFGAQHRGEIELAELMTSTLPGVEQVIFSNTGTEAVQAAIRIARAATGRTKIIKFEGHYHGWCNNILVSYRPKGSDPFAAEAAVGGQPTAEFADTLLLPWNDLDALEKTFGQHAGQIAAVITEPMLVNSGSCMPKEGYLAGLIELCRKHGAVSIFDEVITGFRLALGGAREYFGLKPDLSVYGKAMAAGFTMSAVGGRAEVFDVLRSGRTIHAGTYNGNSINLAAAIATIRTLAEPGVFDRMHAHGRAIREALHRSAAENGHTLLTSGTGTVFSVHFGLTAAPLNYRHTLQADANKGSAFRAAMLCHNIHLLPEGRWYIGAVHTDRELEKVIPAIERSLREIA